MNFFSRKISVESNSEEKSGYEVAVVLRIEQGGYGGSSVFGLRKSLVAQTRP